MINDKWNEFERATYERLSKTGNGKDPEAVDGLAYTVVCELYENRIDREKHESMLSALRDALSEMSEGICTVEKILGVSIREMAESHFGDKMDRLRRDGQRLCEIAMIADAGIRESSCGKVDMGVLEDIKSMLLNFVGLDWKDVAGNVEMRKSESGDGDD